MAQGEPGEGIGRQRWCRQRASAHGQMQKSTAGKFHDARKMALGATISTLQSVLELPRVDFGHGIPCRIASDEDDPSRPSSGPGPATASEDARTGAYEIHCFLSTIERK